MRNKILFIILFGFLSPFSFASISGYEAYGSLTSTCTEDWQAACSTAVSGDGTYKGYVALNYYGSGSHRCMLQNASSGSVLNSTVTIRSCTIDYPDCSEKAGQSFASSIRFPNDEGAESGTECYFSCEGKYSFEDDPSYQCTFSGATATENPEDPEDYLNEDTNDPEYCNNSTTNGSCIDFDHPENEGGCKANGKYYGSFGTEFGEISGCFGGDNDYEPDDDRDGDGIPNEGDDDIDGDGILNEDDTDEDGDGYHEKKDTDGDGIPDDRDPDIDGDGIPNGQDTDKDGDGISNEDDPTPDGDKSTGEASTCAKKPTSSGDAQLNAILQQLWLNECADKDKYGDVAKIGDGGTGSWWESSYPDGFAGVWESKQSSVENGAMVGWLDGFSMTDGGTCPTFPITVDLGFLNLGTFDPLADYCWIFAIIKSIIILTAAFTARALIFGG